MSRPQAGGEKAGRTKGRSDWEAKRKQEAWTFKIRFEVLMRTNEFERYVKQWKESISPLLKRPCSIRNSSWCFFHLFRCQLHSWRECIWRRKHKSICENGRQRREGLAFQIELPRSQIRHSPRRVISSFWNVSVSVDESAVILWVTLSSTSGFRIREGFSNVVLVIDSSWG